MEQPTKEDQEVVAVVPAEEAQDEEADVDDSISVVVHCLTGSTVQLQVATSETVLELQQMLADCVEACFVTSYELVTGGKVLDPFLETDQVEAIKRGNNHLQMRFLPYSEGTAARHVSKFVEVCTGPVDAGFMTSLPAYTSPSHATPDTTPSENGTSTVHHPSGSCGVCGCQPPSGSLRRLYAAYNASLPSATSPPASSATATDEDAPSEGGGIYNDLDYAIDCAADLAPFLQRMNQSTRHIEPSPSGGKAKGGRVLPKDLCATSPNAATKAELELIEETLFNPTIDDSKFSTEGLLHLIAGSATTASVPKVFNRLDYSGWNPVPPNRRMRGDLFYLELETLEGERQLLTASTTGYFVNKSEVRTPAGGIFNPEPRTSPKTPLSETLVGLICDISPLARQAISTILRIRSSIHPLEGSGPIFPLAKSWLVSKSEMQHTYNRTRAEPSSFSTGCGHLCPETRQPSRDWNEELQVCREFAEDTIEHRIFRDRTLFRIHSDFVDACVRASISIVDKQVAPVNPTHPASQHVFIFNNIFFSFAVDGRDIYLDQGGDEAAHFYAKQDLYGIERVQQSGIKGICTIGTCLVDYKGRRVVCQSILPGLLHGQDMSEKHRYGAMEPEEDPALAASKAAAAKEGKKPTKAEPEIRWDPDFHALFEKLGKMLMLKTHTITDKDGVKFELALSVDVKGMKGADGRKYLLEVTNTTPRDANWEERPSARLRRELVIRHGRHLLMQRDAEQSKTSKDDQVVVDEGVKSTPAEGHAAVIDAPAATAATTEGAVAADGDEAKDGEDSKDSQFAPLMTFNPDALTASKCLDKADGGSTDLASDIADVRSVSAYLLETAIPDLISEFTSVRVGQEIPADSVLLVDALHEAGVNLRYLGHIAKLLRQSSPDAFITRLVEQEMVSRVSKRMLRKLMVECPQEDLAVAIAAFLSALLGTPSQASLEDPEDDAVDANAVASEQSPVDTATEAAANDSPVEGENGVDHDKDKASKKKRKKRKKTKTAREKEHRANADLCAWYSGTPPSQRQLYARIRKEVHERFHGELPEANEPASSSSARTSLLRDVCIKTGLRLVGRQYDFTQPAPIAADCIFDIQPIVHHTPPHCYTAQALLESGMARLALSSPESALAPLSQALALYQQSQGPIAPVVAMVYGQLGQLFTFAGQDDQAILHHYLSLLITRRLYGHDSAAVAQRHQLIAALCHDSRRKKESLMHFRRALYLYRLIGGGSEENEVPAATVCLANIGLLYQELGKPKLAAECLQKALLHTTSAQANSPVIGQCYHTVATCNAQMEDYWGAAKAMQEVVAIFSKCFGAKDQRLLDARRWMEEYIKIAMASEKRKPQIKDKRPSTTKDSKTKTTTAVAANA